MRAFFDQLAEDGRGVSTQHKLLVVLQAAFNTALLDEVLDVNPASRIQLEAEEPTKFSPWSLDQVGQFLDVAGIDRLGALYEIAFLTGLRRGELVGLRWIDVDLAGRTLAVEHTRVQAKTGVVESLPKTKSGIRGVALDDRTVGVLLEWKLRQDAEREEWAEAWVECGYVFTREDGAPVNPDYATRQFAKLRKKVNEGIAKRNAERGAADADAVSLLPSITLHGCRHMHITWLHEVGTPENIIKQRVGHSKSGDITESVYTHRSDEAQRPWAEKVATLIPRSQSHTMHTQPA